MGRYYQFVEPVKALLSPTHRSSSVYSKAYNQSDFNQPQPTPLKETPIEHENYLEEMQRRDQILKKRIRFYRLMSRSLSLFISIATLCILLVTLYKFLSTKDVYYSINGAPARTPWAKDTVMWPIVMYIVIAGVSTILNLAVLMSYLLSVDHANRVSRWGTAFEITVLVLHILVWVIGLSLYKWAGGGGAAGRALWGWTCSAGAAKIQKVFADQINFQSYCHAQTSTFWLGIIQSGAILLTVFIYSTAIHRSKRKQRMQTWQSRSTYLSEQRDARDRDSITYSRRESFNFAPVPTRGDRKGASPLATHARSASTSPPPPLPYGDRKMQFAQPQPYTPYSAGTYSANASGPGLARGGAGGENEPFLGDNKI